MNSIDDPRLADFYRWLHDVEKKTQQDLADSVMVSRSHLSLVLSGSRRGRFTWRRLVKVLPDSGLLLLQQCSAWKTDAAKALADRRANEDFAKRFAKFASGNNGGISCGGNRMGKTAALAAINARRKESAA